MSCYLCWPRTSRGRVPGWPQAHSQAQILEPGALGSISSLTTGFLCGLGQIIHCKARSQFADILREPWFGRWMSCTRMWGEEVLLLAPVETRAPAASAHVAILPASQRGVGRRVFIGARVHWGFIPALCANGSISRRATLADPSSRETSPSSRMFSGMCACAGLCRQPWFITSKAINKTWLALPQYIENDLQFESESQCCFSHGIGLINHTVWTAGSAMHFYSSSAFLENLSSMNQNNTISLLPMINRISLLFIHT